MFKTLLIILFSSSVYAEFDRQIQFSWTSALAFMGSLHSLGTYFVGGGKKLTHQEEENRAANSHPQEQINLREYVRIRVSGNENNCFFHALNEAGVNINRPTAISLLLQALADGTYREWLGNEVQAASLVGEYRPTEENLTGTALIQDYILNHLGAPESPDTFNMIGFSPDRPGVIDVLADVLGIRLRIVNNRGRVIRLTQQLHQEQPNYLITLLHDREHFDYLTNQNLENARFEFRTASMTPPNKPITTMLSSGQEVTYWPSSLKEIRVLNIEKYLDRLEMLRSYFRVLFEDSLNSVVEENFEAVIFDIKNGVLNQSDINELYRSFLMLSYPHEDLTEELFDQMLLFFEQEFPVSEWLKRDRIGARRLFNSAGNHNAVMHSIQFLRNKLKTIPCHNTPNEEELIDFIESGLRNSGYQNPYFISLKYATLRINALENECDRHKSRMQKIELLKERKRQKREALYLRWSEDPKDTKGKARAILREIRERRRAQIQGRMLTLQEAIEYSIQAQAAFSAAVSSENPVVSREVTHEEHRPDKESPRLFEQSKKTELGHISDWFLTKTRRSQTAVSEFFNSELLSEGTPDYNAIYAEIRRIGGQVLLNAHGNGVHTMLWRSTSGEPIIYFFDSVHGAQLRKGNKAGAIRGLKKRLSGSGRLNSSESR